MKKPIFFALVLLVASGIGCVATPSSAPASEPIETTAQNNPSPTNTPAPTNAPTSVSIQQEAPAGFSWKGVTGLSPTFLVPNGWHFTTELTPSGNAYYATKEKEPDGNSWKFSTGLAVNVIDSSNGGNAEFAKSLIDGVAKADSTKKVISNSQSDKGGLVTYDLLIEAEYANTPQDSPNHKKTVYHVNAFDKTSGVLYALSFESPTSSWDAESKNGQLMIGDFLNQLSLNPVQPSQTGFTNTLANTNVISVNLQSFERPTGMPSASNSKYLKTTGGGLSAVVPTGNSPWQEYYSLDLRTISDLPSGAVIEVDFENPLDTSTAIAVRLYQKSSGSIHVESPLLTGFKCQNYWVSIYVYSDNSQANLLDNYTQWINSSADLSKVTSVTDFQSGSTCH